MILKDKVALITGASRGIGKAVALALAEQGAYVVGTATSHKGVDAISAFLEKANFEGCGKLLDVTDRASRESLHRFFKESKKSPHILVNNAAITRDNLMLRMSEEEWIEVIETNLNAVFHITKMCLRDMIKAHWGRIINISSVVGITGNAGQANYAAAKAGMIGFTKSLAREVASRNITVNAVAPGFIDTDMTRKLTEEQKDFILKQVPANRMGRPEDVASLVVFLASMDASYITGQTIHLNGGMFMV